MSKIAVPAAAPVPAGVASATVPTAVPVAVPVPAGVASGAARLLDASTPVLMESVENAWFLESGETDLFVVPADAAGDPGRRCYIGSAVAGTLLVGAAPTRYRECTWRLLAVGVNASVVPLRPDWPSALSTSSALRDGLHSWLTATGAALPAPGPRSAISPDRAGDDLALSSAQVLNAPAALLWLLPQDARLRIGNVRQDSPVPTPLGASFCVGVADMGLAAVRTTDQLQAADPRRGIDWAQSALLAAYATMAVTRSEESAARQAGRRENDDAVRASTLATFDRIDAADQWTAAPTDDAVFAACQLLGRAAGIRIVKPPDWSRGQSTDPIRAIARASGVRARAATLGDDWWRHSLEPMVAFSEPNGDPVVLIPRESGAYLAVDPVTGARTKVTEQYARGLRPTAYVLYRPMPPGSLNVRGLLRFGLQGSGRDLLRLLVFSLVAGLLSLAVPIATGTILGTLVPVGETGPVLAASLLLLLVVFATTGFLLSRSAALLRLQGRMLTRMQSGLWDRLIALPVQFFSRFSVADLTQRVNGVDAIQQIIASVASQTLLAVVTLVFSLGLLFVYSVNLAIVVLIVTIITVSVSAVITVAQIRRLRSMYDAKGAASGVLLQVVQGVDKIRAAAAENRALGAWASRFADQAGFLLSSERLSAARTAIYAMLPSFLTGIVFAVVSGNPGTLTTTAFLAFTAALGQVAAATAQLDLSLGYALNVLPLFDRMKPILAEPIEVAPGAGDPGLLAGRVELSAVTYRYPGMDAPVLHEVSITVEPGEFVALVGASGSGKSTIVRLLLGFDRPETGSVTYDGKDLTTLDPRAVRAQIGVAMQNAGVTGADILSVITGDWPLTEDDAWAAAAKVGLADDIRALPMGMRTMVGDNAVTFSGGQRQRLVLAAAIARNPRLVILDEATSALDAVTQATVSESFGRLQVSQVVVAHRLGTIRHADRVIVLDRGHVVQEGTFEGLAGVPGLFQNMVRRQTL
ncbi:MAG TPA: NHLP bacteriocin export ABC transporter permease/ATPase subunit [Nakamurella sp.]|nr:NHLP bacteriocin export ABC transporter permease/ATPase subunit [Nakamurella sp.]